MMTVDFCPNCFAEGISASCPHCGYIPLSQAGSHLVLPPGATLKGRYLLGRALGAGGFGITYLVKDLQTGEKRAVKEYLPAVLAVRASDGFEVYPSSASNRETYEHGLSVFRREAQMLRSFTGNPSIVQVYDYFEANGTAYFAMEYLDGVNLKTLARSMGGTLPVHMAVEILQSIAKILEGVHAQGMLHRDVSPENIFITNGGQTKLIDFGATRFFVGERSQSLSVILKPGFTPPEQYSSRGNQGPWSDVYALCASFYSVVTGEVPPDAPERLSGEPLRPLRVSGSGITQQLASTIKKGLSLDYRKRQQSMEELLRDIGNSDSPPEFASEEAPMSLHGNPYIQAAYASRPDDRWIIPKNLSIFIGRSSQQCNIVVDAPNVSRLHCTVQYDDKKGLFYLTDRSSNGTLVGDERLQKGETRALSPGDVFCLTTRENALKVGLE